MSRQFVRWALVATALTVFAGACGGDDKIEVDGSTAAGQVAGAAGASADAKALCKDSLEVAQAAAIVSADPSKAGELAKYSKTSEGLSKRTTDLQAKNPKDVDYIQACLSASAGIALSTAGEATEATSGGSAPEETTAGSTGSGGTASAEEFCKKVEEIADLITKAKTDPSKAQELAAKMQEFTQLAQQAAAIIAEDPANEKIITECSQKATEAING